MKSNKGLKTFAVWAIIIIIAIALIASILDNSNSQLAYSELVSKIEAGEVKEVELESDGTKASVVLKNENFKKFMFKQFE